jgi:predicted TPR repeat methyltransferase
MQGDDATEWYVTYPQIEQIIKSRLFEGEDTEIMVVGCGTSELGAQLYKDGYHYITNVDFSKNVIDHMREKHA